jgi:hypothetical protein
MPADALENNGKSAAWTPAMHMSIMAPALHQ